jgi:hypothetical protein
MSRRAATVLLLAFNVSAATHSFDVVVCGGSAGGVIAAVAAAREGRPSLVEPATHVGGMVSSGLGYTDVRKKQVIGGFASEFYPGGSAHTTA